MFGNDKAKAAHVSLFIYWGTYLKAHSDGLLCFSCVKRIKLEKIISTAFYASELCRSNGPDEVDLSGEYPSEQMTSSLSDEMDQLVWIQTHDL